MLPSGGSRGRMRGMHPPTSTHSAPKLSIFRSKIEKKILGRGYPSPTRPPGFDHIPLHQRFLDPPLGRGIQSLAQWNDVVSPVSIQTQSLALRALRKRKPQETQALEAPANRNARSKQWQPWLAACQRKRLSFLRFSFTQRTQRTQRKRLKLKKKLKPRYLV